jgi:hypothetical protein
LVILLLQLTAVSLKIRIVVFVIQPTSSKELRQNERQRKDGLKEIGNQLLITLYIYIYIHRERETASAD